LLKVENLSYSFPHKDLYNNISFALEAGQHCAFIGSSGSGKSTLADMLMNPEKYLFDGKIEIETDCRIGFVSQFLQPEKAKDLTVFEYIGEEFIKLEIELASICTEMESSTDLDSLLEKYQQVLDAFQAIDGNNFESNIRKQLNLANLNRHENQKAVDLSGGEFKLVQVIKELITRPDLIIMDEPDVFLDFENLTALKNLINSHPGILLVITHNRYLLHHCFDKIIHLENMELQEFAGHYFAYNLSLSQRKIELQELATAYTDEIERNETLSDNLRFIATNNSESSRGRALKARVKYLERLEAQRIEAPFVNIREPEISLVTDKKIVDSIVLSVKDYRLVFDDELLKNVSFEIRSTDKVALIGSNGTGKTTLLREIYKNDHSSIEINENVEVAYLSQLQGEMLNESNTILEEFFDVGLKTHDAIRSYLASYGFNQDSIDQKIGILSGGEKNILQLAKISAGQASLLLLDEPTSHLDTYSQIALENAIKTYPGAVIMISHDFYSIVNCMDYVLIIEDKTIRKMSMRKFRKMIYNSHFDKDYLELEQKKKSIETKIAQALKDTDFARAKVFSEDLERLA
jgi:ATP-binding cassette, subfamily F, member 3